MKKWCVVMYTFFIITSAVLMGMHNNTTMAPHNDITQVPYDVHMHFIRYSGTPFVAGADYSGSRNRKDRRAQGQRKKELTSEERAQVIGNKIDEVALGIENSGCCNSYTDPIKLDT